MGYVQKLLVPGEKIVFVTRRHWVALLPTILADLGISIVVIALVVAGVVFLQVQMALYALLLLLVPLVHFGVQFISWRSEQYIVTNQRVIDVRGTFGKYVSDTSLEKVNDLVLQQSLLGRFLDYGDLRVIAGSDAGVDRFRRVARPLRLKAAILTQKGQLISKEEVPDLLARLDELRQSGALTEEEFEREKGELLERL